MDDEDDFFGSLLDDATSLAGSATIAGGAVIQSDITGLNLTPALIGKANGINTGANSQMFLLLLLAVGLYLLLRK